MKNFSKLIPLLFLSVLLVACSDSSDTNTSQSSESSSSQANASQSNTPTDVSNNDTTLAQLISPQNACSLFSELKLTNDKDWIVVDENGHHMCTVNPLDFNMDSEHEVGDHIQSIVYGNENDVTGLVVNLYGTGKDVNTHKVMAEFIAKDGVIYKQIMGVNGLPKEIIHAIKTKSNIKMTVRGISVEVRYDPPAKPIDKNSTSAIRFIIGEEPKDMEI